MKAALRADLRILVVGAGLAGAVGGLVYSSTTGPAPHAAAPAAVATPPKPVATAPRPAVKPAPAPATAVRKVARGVLEGVGIESGVAKTRVQQALVALEAKVGRQSDPAALRMAFQAYYAYQAANPGKVRKPYLYYVDYGLDARTPRGYVFDMKTLKVVDGPFTVAHGRGSAAPGSGRPTRFSNRQGSNATSLGLYLAQETYAFSGKSAGVAYRSPGLRLTGVSGKYNSAARARGVVVHGAPYVTAGRAGRSEGCPAVELTRARKLIPRIANGGMVFLFSPLDRTWMKSDPWASRSRSEG